MSVLERRFDDAGTAAALTGKPGENTSAMVEASGARRIRLGLTGLAAIFLLVLVAAAGLRPTASQAAADSQAEPLAVLGVAPGAGPAAVDVAKAPQPAQRPRRT
jgi:hypothetical protein